MGKELKKRSEVRVEDTWAITDLYENDALWKEDLEKAKKLKDHLAGMKGTLGTSAAQLLEFYQCYDELDIIINNLFQYASRKKDEDTTNAVYQDLYGTLTGVYVDICSALSFEDPELIAIPPVILKSFYEEVPALKQYHLHIERKCKKKEHILSESEERIMAAAQDVCSTPSDVYGMFENADLEFPIITDEEGKQVRLTHGNFIPFLECENRNVRKEAFEACYKVYGQFKNTAASLLNGQIKQLTFNSRMRHYESNLQAALDNTEVPECVYHSLIKTVNEKNHIMHRYVKLRKKVLGYEELHMYDLYTPMVPDVAVKIPFEEAKEMILTALKPMGEEYLEILRTGFNSRWIDVYENVGKRSGAYSAGAKVHPFVLMNYADTIDSMFTLAHEMGHALHSYFSNRTQPNIYSDYKIFVAEVASTCNEALLMRYLLEHTEDKTKKAYLVNHFLNKFRGTLFRQTMFAEFELKINEMVEAGESLTAQKLNEIYHELNVRYYGPDVIVDSEIDVEWARIPHFYYNYYVYQYATGYSAAMALSTKILKEGESAVKNYIQFLSGGCSTDPISLLKIAGVDMSTSTPIESALDIFEQLVIELEELIG